MFRRVYICTYSAISSSILVPTLLDTEPDFCVSLSMLALISNRQWEKESQRSSDQVIERQAARAGMLLCATCICQLPRSCTLVWAATNKYRANISCILWSYTYPSKLKGLENVYFSPAHAHAFLIEDLSLTKIRTLKNFFQAREILQLAK